MQLRDYRKLGNISLDDMLAKLRAVAAPGELDKTRRATILRHETGLRFPGARMQMLYRLATDDAVKPDDWVKLHTPKQLEEETCAQA